MFFDHLLRDFRANIWPRILRIYVFVTGLLWVILVFIVSIIGVIFGFFRFLDGDLLAKRVASSCMLC